MLKTDGQRIIYHYYNEEVWIEPWGEDSVRVRAVRQAAMPADDFALEESVSDSGAAVRECAEGLTLQNGKIRVVISHAGKIIFYNQKGKLLLEEYVRNRKDVMSGNCSALCIDAREFRPILGGDYSLTVRFESDPDEKLFGMGQYQQPFLNLKGCELELAQRNSQASVPFLLSSAGYGFLWNNPAIGRVTFGRNITSWRADSTNVMDYWVTAGDAPSEIEEHYASVTGKSPMMPDYAMGFWQSKLRYQTQEELLSVAREYHRRKVPLSVIVVDFFHWPKEGEWRFDPEYWPDPAGMVRELADMGMKLMVSVWPTVDHGSSHYKIMQERGMLINVDRGYPCALYNVANTMHIDVTNPNTREYVWDIIRKNYYEAGIHTFWLDEAEPEYSYYDFDIYRYHLGTNLRIGNSYPKYYAKMFYDGMRKEGQSEILNLVRCAWAGSQKYGALVWSGDIASSFSSMRNQLAAGLNMGIAGIPWWTTDIGGFHGGNPDDPAFRELFVRWFEFGTFCPVMRLHGDREPHKKALGTSGGGLYPSGADNEIWSYGEEVYEICRNYILLRENMKEYIKETMENAHRKGTPVIRPLFYNYPEDKKAWEIGDEYLFGDRLLVAPVMEQGVEERKVYLPEGCDWYDAWTGERVAGGMTVLTDAIIDRIPVYTSDETMLSFFETMSKEKVLCL